jgi:hypothetical protein
MHLTNRAFAKLVVEIDFPMSRWGREATEEYLSYSLDLLDILNSISSSLSHLSRARISIFHALTLIKTSPAAKIVEKIPRKTLGKEFKFERSGMIGERPASKKEFVLLKALMVSKKIGFLTLGFVLSGLCSDATPYLEIRKFAGELNDSVIEGLDLRFYKEVSKIHGTMEEVREINISIDRLSAGMSAGSYSEAVEELNMRLKVLENSIQDTEKEANDMFSLVLGTRNKLLDGIRFTGHAKSSSS